MKTKLAVLFISLTTLTLASCGTYQPQIVQTGPDSYYIVKNASSSPGVGILKQDVTTLATGFCKHIERRLQIISVHETQPPFGQGNQPRGEIKFRCVSKQPPAGK